jgi:uncharacterized membrane protein (DUF373 family)
MNYLKDHPIVNRAVKLVDSFVSLLIFATILGLVLYIVRIVVEMFVYLPSSNINQTLYSVAIIIILVKAYRILVFYMNKHHVSIKYIVEIAIIAPAIELIFIPSGRDLGLNIVYALFSLGSLLIYVLYFTKLCDADHIDMKEEENIEREKIQ